MIICGSYGEICAKWCLYQFEEWTNNSRNNSRKGLNEESLGRECKEKERQQRIKQHSQHAKDNTHVIGIENIQ